MPFSETLAERIRTQLSNKHVAYEEKKMMGGLTFMVDGKMCMGVVEDSLMARIDPEEYEQALTREGTREMDFTGRPMKGFLFIDPRATASEEDLEYWVQRCLDFNPKARSSKKKKR